MERREFLKVALGFTAAAGAVTLAGVAQAAPMIAPTRQENDARSPDRLAAEPAVANENDLAEARLEQVQWRRRRWRRRWGWRPRRRYWGYHRRRWRRRFYW